MRGLGPADGHLPGTSYMVAAAQPCGHCGQRCMCVYGTRNAVLGSTGTFFSFFSLFFWGGGGITGLVCLLHHRSSIEILPDYWGTFCAGICPKSVFSFLVAAGFKPTSLSLQNGRLNRYPILTPQTLAPEGPVINYMGGRWGGRGGYKKC